MQILLITTAPNGILEYLRDKEDVKLCVVDCSSLIPQKTQKANAKVVKENILNAIRTELTIITPDILLTYRCPCILPPEIFCMAKITALNIHPSMLPKYPGANPWKDVYENKEKESGVTIHVIDEGVDSGTIIAQRKIDIDLEKNIKWHQSIVEEKAIEMLNVILFALNDYGQSSLMEESFATNDPDIESMMLAARQLMAAGYVCDKLDMQNKSNTFFEKSIKHYKSIANYFESIEDYNKALTQYVFVLMLCMKVYGQKHEQTALCYEHAAELQAKMGMEEKAMNSQRMANILREKIYGYNHEQYIQGLQKFGAIGFLIGEYKRKKGII